MTKFFDTNILLSHLDVVDKENFFLLSSVTLRELEHIKVGTKSEDVKYEARRATRYLNEHSNKYKVIVYDLNSQCDFCKYGLEDTPDNRIMKCAVYSRDVLEYSDLVFVTNDILCKLIAKEYFGLTVESVEGNKDGIYKGYKKIVGNTSVVNDYMNNFDASDWNINEYLIIENTDDGSIKEMRYDGESFVTLKLPSSRFIKGKNSLQRCALDTLMNPDITIAAILGTYGSGKTFMAMQMALYNVQEKGKQSKILGVREVVGQGKEIGFLPGDMESKVGSFFSPLSQSLSGGEFELASLKAQGVLETNIPFFMKGTTYNETIILCDEAEDLNESQIRLIGTRLGQNSKIYFSGDYKQSVINSGENNALVKMCNEFKGNPMFACICLEEDVRSETSKLFAELFKK